MAQKQNTAVNWLINEIEKDQLYKYLSSSEWIKAFEQATQMEREQHKNQSIEFLKWLKENDTPERAEEWFHYSDEDMYEAFLEELNQNNGQ